MDVVNKLGLVLTVIFVISLVLLSLQILYLLWRKRRFQLTAGLTDTTGRHVEFGSGGDHHHLPTPSASKELLYFFCWKNYQASRIEPAADSAAVVVATVEASAPTEDEELEEMLKLHELYGASRALFTIKEESEKEEMENGVVLAEMIKKNNKEDVVGQRQERMPAVASTVTAREVVVIEVDDDDDDDEATLFRTPCASPPYYTPSPSPPREDGAVSSGSHLIITTDKIAGR